jgi:hypothetical protein
MCFYDCNRYACGDWKWGNMKQQCNKEYRMGEVCGMKLTHETISLPNNCRLCEKLQTKMRKRETECERLRRWQASNSNPASQEKAYATIAALDTDIKALYDEIAMRRQNLSGQRPSVQEVSFSSSYAQPQYDYNSYSGYVRA